MANKFGAQLRGNMEKSEKRVANALDGKPEQMVKPTIKDVQSNEDDSITTKGSSNSENILVEKENEVNEDSQKTKEPATTQGKMPPVPQVKKQKQVSTTSVLSGKDAFREEYLQLFDELDFTSGKSMNFQIPNGIRAKFIAIKEVLSDTNKSHIKLSAQDIVKVFLCEGVEKWYNSITGKND